MSLPDPNAAAPATDQPAEVIATTDEIEKKRIELKSMLSGCIASGKLQVMKAQEGLDSISGTERDQQAEREQRDAMATGIMKMISELDKGVVHPEDVEKFVTPNSHTTPPQYEVLVVSSGGATSGFLSKITESSWSCALRAVSVGLFGSEAGYAAMCFVLSQALLDGLTLLDEETEVEKSLLSMIREELSIADSESDVEAVNRFWKAIEAGEVQVGAGELWLLSKKLGCKISLMYGNIVDGRAEAELAETLSPDPSGTVAVSEHVHVYLVHWRKIDQHHFDTFTVNGLWKRSARSSFSRLLASNPNTIGESQSLPIAAAPIAKAPPPPPTSLALAGASAAVAPL